MNKGHIELFLPKHPKSNGSGYIRRSHIVLEQAGVEVPAGTEVHHINEDMKDDSLENLSVLTIAEHAKIHGVTKPRRRNGQFGKSR